MMIQHATSSMTWWALVAGAVLAVALVLRGLVHRVRDHLVGTDDELPAVIGGRRGN